MARLFDDVQSEYLGRDGAPVTTPPFAMVCFIYTNDLEIDCVPMGIADKSANVDSHFLLIRESDDKIRAFSYDGTASEAIATSACSINTWHHVCGIFVSATDRRALLDAGSKGTHATSVTPTNIDRMGIGTLYRLAPSSYWSGRVAEAAIYDLSAYPGATASDKADYFEANVLPGLAAGDEPPFFTTGLISHWPLVDDDEDHVGSFDLTPINTPSWDDHPPMKRRFIGTADAQSTASCDVKVLSKVAGTADATSTASAAVKVLRKVDGGADAQSTASCAVMVTVFITGTADAQSTAQAGVTVRVFIIGTADGQSTASVAVKVLRKITCTADAQSTATMSIIGFVHIECTADGQATATCTLIVMYNEIPPVMHRDLIDPYGDMGAWLWLAEIVVPTQTTQRIACNTAVVIYGVTSFAASNFDVSKQSLSSDGSIPRIGLRVAQDEAGTLEDIVNATKGGEDGTVKLIRTCEKYFDSPVKALERTYDILTAGSDYQWVTFVLGLPNPLLQRIPLWSYNSKVCPLATLSLFKGVRCQYAGVDAVCTGLFEDCYTKGNAVHWGAELGLDPNAVRV